MSNTQLLSLQITLYFPKAQFVSSFASNADHHVSILFVPSEGISTLGYVLGVLPLPITFYGENDHVQHHRLKLIWNYGPKKSSAFFV